jgi:hypothetical protein
MGVQAEATAAAAADQQQLQPYGSHDTAAAAARGHYGVGLDSLLEYTAPHMQQYPGTLQGLAAGTGVALRPQLQDAVWAAAAMQQQLSGAAVAGCGSYSHDAAAVAAATAAMAGYAGMPASYGSADAAAAAAASGYGAPADWASYAAGSTGAHMYAGAGAAAGAAASAGAAAAGSSGGDLKRKRSDPRLNCIKSVQYRVSRFPQELHDMCVEHWERTRCARVVCNGVQGVMSVQGGRCVVSFSQHGQEVLKGVADYLRYAGEDRIKKWRRHVRMVGGLQWLAVMHTLRSMLGLASLEARTQCVHLDLLFCQAVCV